MGWNHRIMRSIDQNSDPFYAVHEVYYAKSGKINGWTQDPVRVGSEDRDGILVVLAQMAEAVGQPVLDFATGLEVEAARVLSDSFLSLLSRVPDIVDDDLLPRRPDRAEAGKTEGGDTDA